MHYFRENTVSNVLQILDIIGLLDDLHELLVGLGVTERLLTHLCGHPVLLEPVEDPDVDEVGVGDDVDQGVEDVTPEDLLEEHADGQAALEG